MHTPAVIVGGYFLLPVVLGTIDMRLSNSPQIICPSG